MWNRELMKNKLYSLSLMGLGALSILIEYDATFFVFSLMIGVPLFFSKENWIMDGEYNRHNCKKSKGKVCGESLMVAEKKAMDIKIKRQLGLKQFCGKFALAVQKSFKYYAYRTSTVLLSLEWDFLIWLMSGIEILRKKIFSIWALFAYIKRHITID